MKSPLQDILDYDTLELLHSLSSLQGVEKFALDLLRVAGREGLEQAKRALDALVKGEVPDFSGLPPRVASDLTAYLQNAEADRREEVKEAVEKMEKIAIQIGLALIKGLVLA